MSNGSLELSSEDAEVLSHAIRHYLNELHDEIAHTDNYDYRQELHTRQHRLEALLSRIAGS